MLDRPCAVVSFVSPTRYREMVSVETMRSAIFTKLNSTPAGNVLNVVA